MHQALQNNILSNPRSLIRHIISQVRGDTIAANWMGSEDRDGIKGSAVLFLLTQNQTDRSAASEPCLLLNKRSRHVLQPGDLCCPGGGVNASDKVLSPLMQLPLSPLRKWPHWSRLRVEQRQLARQLALFLTTGLREAWEEMRLNPLTVSFLGPLPVQQLVLFERQIFPLAAWVSPHRSLKPNWEVERIVHVPLRRLLDPGNYGRYRLTFNGARGTIHRKSDFPCFIHHGRDRSEILWGATFRIAMDFLKLVFGFNLPDLDTLPVIQGDRGESYLNGSLWELNGLLKEERSHDH